MKLLAPVSNLASAVQQIKAGANEIYVGGDTPAFQSFSFSGRAKFNPNNQKICPDMIELTDIVAYAHEHNVFVMYAANTPVLANDPEGSSTYEQYFLEYIEQGLKIHVDSIVVADLGAILLLRQKGINTHLTASTFLETTNSAQIEFLKEFGVNRVVLSYQVTMAEIEALTAGTDLEIEVFGHYGCSFHDGYCNFKHSFGEVDSAKVNIGVPCQNSYQLVDNENRTLIKGQFLNASLTCSICSLPGLMKAGVCSIKMVGRDLSPEQNAVITGVYAEILKQLNGSNSLLNDKSLETMERLRKDILPDWWVNNLCLKGLCKYLDNPITKSFVGRQG